MKEGKFESIALPLWGRKSAEWMVRFIPHASSPPCANARFPVLDTEDPRADNWVQIIRFHRPAPE